MSRTRWKYTLCVIGLGFTVNSALAAKHSDEGQTAAVPGYSANLPATITHASVLSPIPPASHPPGWRPGGMVGPQRIGPPGPRKSERPKQNQ